MKNASMTRGLACAVVACGALPASAADFRAGAWDMSVAGTVNAYYTHANGSGTQTFTGSRLAVASQALGCNGNDQSTVIGNGLLPNTLTAVAKTNQGGWDFSAKVLLAYAVSNADSLSSSNNVDVRHTMVVRAHAWIRLPTKPTNTKHEE